MLLLDRCQIVDKTDIGLRHALTRWITNLIDAKLSSKMISNYDRCHVVEQNRYRITSCSYSMDNELDRCQIVVKNDFELRSMPCCRQNGYRIASYSFSIDAKLSSKMISNYDRCHVVEQNRYRITSCSYSMDNELDRCQIVVKNDFELRSMPCCRQNGYRIASYSFSIDNELDRCKLSP